MTPTPLTDLTLCPWCSAPQNNRTENGLMCPSCIAPFQETCPGTQAARCVGQETHCIYFAGNVQAGEGRSWLSGGREHESGSAGPDLSSPYPQPRVKGEEVTP